MCNLPNNQQEEHSSIGSTPSVKECNVCKEPTIKFVENLWAGTAFSLVWIREIHIDKEFEYHKHLSKLITHEKKHLEYYDRWLAAKSETKKFLITLQNNIWDFLSCWKLQYYLDKAYFVGETSILVAATIFILASVLGVKL